MRESEQRTAARIAEAVAEGEAEAAERQAQALAACRADMERQQAQAVAEAVAACREEMAQSLAEAQVRAAEGLGRALERLDRLKEEVEASKKLSMDSHVALRESAAANVTAAEDRVTAALAAQRLVTVRELEEVTGRRLSSVEGRVRDIERRCEELKAGQGRLAQRVEELAERAERQAYSHRRNSGLRQDQSAEDRASNEMERLLVETPNALERRVESLGRQGGKARQEDNQEGPVDYLARADDNRAQPDGIATATEQSAFKKVVCQSSSMSLAVDNLQASLTSLHCDFQHLLESQKDLKTSLDSLAREHTRHEAAFSKLLTRVENIDKRVCSLHTELNGQSTQPSGIRTELDSLQAQVTALLVKVTGLALVLANDVKLDGISRREYGALKKEMDRFAATSKDMRVLSNATHYSAWFGSHLRRMSGS